MEKQIKVWNLIEKIREDNGDDLEGMHIIEQEEFFDDTSLRVYHKDGFCWVVAREYTCTPDEVNRFDNVHTDGFTYIFEEEFDGFNKSGIDLAIDILQGYLT